MSENTSKDSIPSPEALLQLLTGYWSSQAVYVAARLRIADLLVDGPRSVEELAAASNAHAPSLKRLLRALSMISIFTETQPGSYSLTPLGELLRTDSPASVRAPALMYNEEQYRAWGDLLYSIQTGEPAFEHHFGISFFTYLSQNPDANQVFNDAMSGWSAHLYNNVVNSYDFSQFHTIVDVGGGHGHLLAIILRCNPAAQGILFDQPHVAIAAKQYLAQAGLTERCSAVGGDFFREVPTGGDVYLLATVLHDFNDERCISILQQCRRAMPEHGKLLVIELVLPTGYEPSVSKWLDLHMLVLLGGRERTASEYDALFRSAGFELTRVISTQAPQCIVEAIPV